jgi:hypothetical protein
MGGDRIKTSGLVIALSHCSKVCENTEDHEKTQVCRI